MSIGEPLDAWTRREIYAPLGMRSTTFSPPADARAAIPPTEQDTRFRQRIVQGEVQDENASVLCGVAGHAGLFSNVFDLIKFADALLVGAGKNAEIEKDKALFAPQTVEYFARRQPPQGSSRALGWDTPSENSSSGTGFSPRSIGHLGYSGCSLWIDLDAAVAVVLLTNRTWPDRGAATAQLIRQVRPAFHDAIRQAL